MATLESFRVEDMARRAWGVFKKNPWPTLKNFKRLISLIIKTLAESFKDQFNLIIMSRFFEFCNIKYSEARELNYLDSILVLYNQLKEAKRIERELYCELAQLQLK